MPAKQTVCGPHLRRILAAILAVLFYATLGDAAPAKNRIRYRDGVRFATEAGPPEGPCLFLWGLMTAPDFFAGLERRQTAKGTEFQRNSQEVTQFPEELILRIRIREFPCRVRVKKEEEPPQPKLSLETMGSLRFEAYWKRGVRLRRTEGLRLRTFFVEKEQPLQLVAMPRLAERNVWVYEFAVPSAGVPLTDHFILSIFTEDGRRLARVSARL